MLEKSKIAENIKLLWGATHNSYKLQSYRADSSFLLLEISQRLN